MHVYGDAVDRPTPALADLAFTVGSVSGRDGNTFDCDAIAPALQVTAPLVEG